MGLFDIFRRHKKKEEEKTPDSSSAVVQSETALEDESADTTSAAPASAPIHPEPVNIPPADSYEEKINPDGTRETLHNGVKEEETSEESHSEEVADSSKKKYHHLVLRMKLFLQKNHLLPILLKLRQPLNRLKNRPNLLQKKKQLKNQ